MTTYGVALRKQCNLFFCAYQKATSFFTLNLFSKGNHKNSPRKSQKLSKGIKSTPPRFHFYSSGDSIKRYSVSENAL